MEATTDNTAAPVPGASRGTLALAFVAVTLAAVALLAELTAAFAASDVSSLASRQRQELTATIAVAGSPPPASRAKAPRSRPPCRPLPTTP